MTPEYLVLARGWQARQLLGFGVNPPPPTHLLIKLTEHVWGKPQGLQKLTGHNQGFRWRFLTQPAVYAVHS